jgi:exodeoxyribonuclease VII large subunit
MGNERIELIRYQLMLSSSHFLTLAHKNIRHLEQIVSLTDPQNILRKGYSITYVNDLPLRDSAQLKSGDIINTVLAIGSFESEVKTVQTP